MPNWRDPLSVTSAYQTVVGTGDTGAETRRAGLEAPSRLLNFTLMNNADSSLRLHQLLLERMTQAHTLIPLWTDFTDVATVAAVNTTLTGVFSYRRFAVGGRAVVYHAPTKQAHFSVVTDVTATTITLEDEMPFSATDVVVAPLMEVEPVHQSDMSWVTTEINTATMAVLERVGPSSLDATDGVTDLDTFEGLPIWPWYATDGDTRVTIGSSGKANKVGYGHVHQVHADDPRQSMSMSVGFSSREEWWQLNKLFDYCKGRLHPFWILSHGNDFRLQQKLTDSAIQVVEEGPSNAWQKVAYIGFDLVDDTQVIAEIDSVLRTGMGDNINFVGTPLAGIPVEDIRRVTIARKARFEKDTLEEEWITNEVVNCRCNIREVVDEKAYPTNWVSSFIGPKGSARCDVLVDLLESVELWNLAFSNDYTLVFDGGPGVIWAGWDYSVPYRFGVIFANYQNTNNPYIIANNEDSCTAYAIYDLDPLDLSVTLYKAASRHPDAMITPGGVQFSQTARAEPHNIYLNNGRFLIGWHNARTGSDIWRYGDRPCVMEPVRDTIGPFVGGDTTNDVLHFTSCTTEGNERSFERCRVDLQVGGHHVGGGTSGQRTFSPGDPRPNRWHISFWARNFLDYPVDNQRYSYDWQAPYGIGGNWTTELAYFYLEDHLLDSSEYLEYEGKFDHCGAGSALGFAWSSPRTSADGKTHLHNVQSEGITQGDNARLGKVFVFQGDGWGESLVYENQIVQRNFQYSSDQGFADYAALSESGTYALVSDANLGLSAYTITANASAVDLVQRVNTQWTRRFAQTTGTLREPPFGFNLGSSDEERKRSYFGVDQATSVAIFRWPTDADDPQVPFRTYTMNDLFPYGTFFSVGYSGAGQIYSAAHDNLLVVDTTNAWPNISDPSAHPLWTGTIRIVLRAFR